MDDDDFLAAVEADNASASVEEPKVETPPVAEEPKAEPEKAEQEEPPLELTELAPEQTKPTEGFVPLGAVLDERDKRKALEVELERLRSQQPQPQLQMPDPYEDPEGFASAQQALLDQRLQNITLNTSERFARKEHGPETVESAKGWALQRFGTDPLYRQQVLNDPDPYERVVKDWRAEQMLAEVNPSEFEQFKAWKAAQGQLQMQPGGQPPPSTSAPTIPAPSLASAPSAGSILTEVPVSEEDIFDGAIPKR